MVAEIRGMPRSDRKKKIEEVVAEVKMEEWLDKKVGKFSKGMKQRINISAALLSEPEILLLDEPSTGLDPRGMSEVREIVKSLKHKNRLIFMSSHLLNEVSELQKSKEGGQRFILSPEQQQELVNFRKKEADAKLQLKQMRKQLRSEIDSLEN